VAGDRGRKTNYVYGVAKGLVERYAQGLKHRLAGTGVKVVLIKPGPTDTPMTAYLKQQGRNLASVEEVSQRIVKAIDQGIPVVYAPANIKRTATDSNAIYDKGSIDFSRSINSGRSNIHFKS
jgi:short-subunit dehydrogenase